MAASSVTIFGGPTQAAAGDGSLTVNVFNDLDLSATHGAGDPRLTAEVRITDSAENSITRTATNGVLNLTGTDIGLAGGAYRVSVQNPDTGLWTDAQVDRDLTDHFDPTESFIDLSSGTAATLNVGFVDHDQFTNSNRVRVYSGVHPTMRNAPWDAFQEGDAPKVYGDKTELFSAPFNLSQSVNYSGVADSERPVEITTKDTTTPDGQNKGPVGTVYGVGTDAETQMMYVGAYAKRGSSYGPDGGPGSLYRVNTVTGAVQTYATVANAGSTQHNYDSNSHDDFAFRTAVGREALGDVDVSPNGKWLTTVNLNTDSLVVYPIQAALDPAPIQTLEVPDQGCATDWTPFALEEKFIPARKSYVLHVGATCGSTGAAYVLTYLRDAVTGELTFDAVKGQGDTLEINDRIGRDIGGEGLQNPGNLCALSKFVTWTDDVPTECLGLMPTTVPDTGKPQFTLPQPMLADIEITDDGRFILGFRDRANDQYLTATYAGESGGQDRFASYIGGGDVVWADFNGTSMTFNDSNTTFRDASRLPTWQNFQASFPWGGHSQAAIGAMAYFNGKLVGTQMDVVGFDDNGLRQWNVKKLEAGKSHVYKSGTPPELDDGTDRTFAPETARLQVTNMFSKAVGMADVDTMVRQATNQIGNRIWIDQDGDGLQTAGEPAVEGVVVRLVATDGTVIAETTTDANGEYYFHTFDGLDVNTDYEIRIPRNQFAAGAPLAGYSPTIVSSDASQAAYDNNGETTADGHVSAMITSPPVGQNDHTIDFGFIEPVSIGDYVWLDADKDGIQDPTEQPLAGVEVKLLDGNGDPVLDTDGNPRTATTDANGYYAFTDLRTLTDYQVEFPTRYVAPDGRAYDLTQQAAGADRATDSNPDPDSGLTPVIKTPSSGDNSGAPTKADNPTIDAGYVPVLVSIGNYTWFDTDADGTQDASEEPASDVTVALLDKDGNPVLDADGNPRTVQTDADGFYVFTDLNPDTDYVVRFQTVVTDADGITHSLTVQGVDQSTVNPANDSDTDSNPAPATGEAKVRTPSTGNNSSVPGNVDVPTIDAGYVVRPVSIGDYVWIDADKDGVQDAGEKPLGNVLVTLLDADGNPVLDADGNPREARTDANGYYAFGDLAPNTDYTVTFEKRVTLADGTVYVLTSQISGDDTAADSNPDPGTGSAPVTTPRSGENSTEPDKADDPTIDAGYVRLLVSIGDYVWYDSDRDGEQDSGEKPVEGAVLTLLDADQQPVLDADGNPRTATTNADGFYAFGDLNPDTVYFVRFETTVTDADGVVHTLTTSGVVQGDLTDQADDSGTDSNPKQDTGLAKALTPSTGSNLVTPGDVDLPTIDGGYVTKLVSIGDKVWIDTNGNGIQDDGEPPVVGAVVKLLDKDGNPVLDKDGNPVTSTTNDNGYYWFNDLEPNTDVQVQFPETVTVDGVVYELVPPTSGDDRGTDSNPDPSTGIAPVTTPKDGENRTGGNNTDNPTIDAGYTPELVSIGDKLWIDTNNNGVQDKGEPPVAGVVVKLLDKDGNPVLDKDGNPVTSTTGANGYYSFTDLPPNTDFIVEFPLKVTVDGVTYLLTQPGAGSDRGTDSNPETGTGWAPVTTPARGDNSGEPNAADDPTIDAGYVAKPKPPVTPTPTPTPSDNPTPTPTDNPPATNPPSEDEGDLPETGMSLSTWAIALGLMAVLGGTLVLLFWRPRRRH